MSPERSIYDLFKVIVGYYETGKLYYVAKMRNGFVPLVRQEVYRKFKGLEIGHQRDGLEKWLATL